ncbi:alpha/beta hydrolase family protein [Hymenobacter glacialis]|nr:alpha/beta fold hydrolase [Hymenobacter glacialis]
MNLSRLLLAFSALTFFGLSLTGAAKASTIEQARLTGTWTGPLTLPGGRQAVSITINQYANGTTAAVLHAAEPQLDNIALRVVRSADSVVFYADNAGYRFVAQPLADGKRLRGQWQQPGFRTTLVLARVQASEERAASPASPKSRKAAEARGTSVYMTEDVQVTSTNSLPVAAGLGGSLRMPMGQGPFPAVMLLSDESTASPANAGHNLLDELADYLTRQGMAVLTLDSRGQGRSMALPVASSNAELVADAQSGLLFLRTHSGIDPMQVGILGHGAGANIALVAATQAPAPAFLVALGAAGVNGQELLARQTSLVNQAGEADTAQAAWSLREMQVMDRARQLTVGLSPPAAQAQLARQQYHLEALAKQRSDALYKRQYAMLEIIRQTPDNSQAQAIVANMLKQIYPNLAPATAHIRAGQLTSPWYRSLLVFNPQPELQKVSCPTLLLHGTADKQVPSALNLPLLEKGLKGNKRVKTLKLDGVNHAFQAPAYEQTMVSSEALESISEWVLQQVKQ